MKLLTTALVLFLAMIVASQAHSSESPFILVLGVAQDGGHPQAGCTKECCRRAAESSELAHHVACLALVDPGSQRRWLIDATPDMPSQLRMLDRLSPVAHENGSRDLGLQGIFLTHAHMGHYTGLMHLGREAAGADGIPVHAMPRLSDFLKNNGPWSQLVSLHNIELQAMEADRSVELAEGLSITPRIVPHRDEYSETVGFVVKGPDRSVLFVPDIDKWERWELKLEEILGEVDRAYVDGTFFAIDELPGRDMSEIPHPFIEETLDRIASLPASERSKIRFLHLNHSNPALDPNSPAAARIREAGAAVATEGERFAL